MIIAAIAVTAAAGCSRGSSLPTDATGTPTLSAVASSIGCTGLKPMKEMSQRYNHPLIERHLASQHRVSTLIRKARGAS